MNSKVKWAIIIIVVAVIIFCIKIFTQEDDWICQNGKWVKHGNPSTEMPNQKCMVE